MDDDESIYVLSACLPAQYITVQYQYCHNAFNLLLNVRSWLAERIQCAEDYKGTECTGTCHRNSTVPQDGRISPHVQSHSELF